MKISQKLETTDLVFSKDALRDLDRFAESFLEWNAIHNLGGAKDLDSLYPHILDSLYPLSFLEEFANCMDIGTGAGFPGLILAICKRDAHFFLVEPRVKRASFLQFIKATLRLDNVTIIRERVEDIESFTLDLITSKAVTDAKMLYALSKRFLKEDSKLLLYKGKKTQAQGDAFKNVEIFTRDSSSYLLINQEESEL